MELLVLYLIFVVLIIVAARSRGRSGIAWGLLALFISPLLAGFFLLVMGSRVQAPQISLETDMRNEIIRQKYGSYIRVLKPPFSNKAVYETTVGGSKKRFHDKGQALVYVASIVDSQAPIPITGTPVLPPHSSDLRG